MPISGVVITGKADKMDEVESFLQQFQPQLEIHGTDEKGHIVSVLETESSEEMEKIIDTINKQECILNVGMTYLNTEDEADRMAKGERLAKPFGFRKTTGPVSLADEEE